MKSASPKVLHESVVAPCSHYSLGAAGALDPHGRSCVVVGHEADSEAVREPSRAGRNSSSRPSSAGPVTRCSSAKRSRLVGFSGDVVLVLYGDTPLLRAETLAAAWRRHKHRSGADLVMLTLVSGRSPGHRARHRGAV